MSAPRGILISFPCDHSSPVAELARKYLPVMEEITSEDVLQSAQEASLYLGELASRSGEIPGPNGGFSTYSYLGDWTDIRQIIVLLKDFWRDLLTYKPKSTGPLSSEHILIFEQVPDTGMTVYEMELVSSTKVHDVSEAPMPEEINPFIPNIWEDELILGTGENRQEEKCYLILKTHKNMPFTWGIV